MATWKSDGTSDPYKAHGNTWNPLEELYERPMGDPLVNAVKLLEFHGSRTNVLSSHGSPVGVPWTRTERDVFTPGSAMGLSWNSPWFPTGLPWGVSAAKVLLWDHGYPTGGSPTGLLRDFHGIMVLGRDLVVETHAGVPWDSHGAFVRILSDFHGNLS